MNISKRILFAIVLHSYKKLWAERRTSTSVGLRSVK